MTMEEQTIDKVKDPDEIDLIALVKTAWKGRKTITWFLIIFAVFGVLLAHFSPVEYSAKTILVPQIQSKSSGLGGLAVLAGINLPSVDQGGSELSPSVYPQIVKSITFQKEIMYTPFTWEGIKEPISLIAYYKDYYRPGPIPALKKYTIGLPGVLIGLIKGKNQSNTVSTPAKEDDGMVPLSKPEKGLRGFLDAKLTLEINSKEGYIQLMANAPEAKAAAQMALKAQRLLQAKITEYKIDKAKQNLDFIQELFKEKKKDFENAQDRLARFRDRNLNLGSAMARTEEESLQSEYQIAFSVYNEVAKQLENAKIKVKEDTPVFAIIEPVSVPLSKAKPEKVKIIIIWIFLGGIIGIGWIFGKHYLVDLKKKWKETE